MLARKCDRCDELYEEKPYRPDVVIEQYEHPYGDKTIDLCPNCQHELESWLFKYKERSDKDARV